MAKKPKFKGYLYKRNTNAKDNPDGQEILTKLRCVSYLPPAKVQEGLTYIKELIEAKFNKNSKTYKMWQSYIKSYFEVEWMQKVKPEVFCNYPETDRTNNHLESYHRTINKDIGTKPSVEKFLCEYSSRIKQ